MRVLNHLELSSRLERSGIGTAVTNQRQALDQTDLEIRTTPTKLVTQSLDLVHCNMIGPETLVIATWASRTGTPLLLHAHVTSEDFAESFRASTPLSRPLERYLRWFYSRADLVLCPSEYTKGLLKQYPVDTPVRPITNGVDIDSLAGFEKLRSEYRNRFDLSGLVVFAVGNVFERKGISTFCRLAEETPYEFVWFGPYERGLLASPIVTQWTEQPPENLTFTGWIDDIRGAYGAGDVFLFPTKNENQGIAVLEAMACGKPVVLRRLPVFEEWYTHGKDCLLCDTREDFRAALEQLASDPALRHRLGVNARETAREHSLDRLAVELPEIYESVARGEPKSA